MEEIQKISERKAAELINVSSNTLSIWRKKNLIPCELYEAKIFIKKNKRIMYSKYKFLNWYHSLNL